MSKIKSLNNQQLIKNIEQLILQARKQVVSSVNTVMVYTYFSIGKMIVVENEQKGNKRAKYGEVTLKVLSQYLTDKFGKGWTVENLTLMRKFFIVYSDNKINNNTNKDLVNTVCQIEKQSKNTNSKFVNTVYEIDTSNRFVLSWSHYIILMRIENVAERKFYEIECAKQNWSVRQLSRQINSSLYERLALSRRKEDVLKLSTKGQVIEKPSDIIKNPLTLEFLGLKTDSSYTETKLEQAIINKLQEFLLELGKGFLFEARQKRFTFNEQHFFVDLVFYNRLLQCYVLIDLKIDKLTHQDLGQMQMYVNYYDRYVIKENEKPTIGILLCKEKNDALIKLTLPKDSNIYAQEYKLYLPDKKLLQAKLKEWIKDFESKKDKEEIK